MHLMKLLIIKKVCMILINLKFNQSKQIINKRVKTISFDKTVGRECN